MLAACNTLARLVCYRRSLRLPKAKDGRGTMILTKCAVCATELELTLGKKCGRCSTRYCGPECQKKHWEEGGHDKLCKLIKKAGGAEQYNANKRYTEALAVAVEKCAEDTKGQISNTATKQPLKTKMWLLATRSWRTMLRH